MPFIRRLLDGQPPVKVEYYSYHVPRPDRVIGIAVRVFLPTSLSKQHIDQTWPSLTIDNTGTRSPPYILSTAHVRARGVYFVEVTMLQPNYVTGAMTGVSTSPPSSIQDSGLDQLPHQLPYCPD
jgi:hypothetical protein